MKRNNRCNLNNTSCMLWLLYGEQSVMERVRAKLERWLWVSMKPGTTVFPSRSAVSSGTGNLVLIFSDDPTVANLQGQASRDATPWSPGLAHNPYRLLTRALATPGAGYRI